MTRAQQILGQTIVIENVSGASGTIGTGRVVRADPDGYTIGIDGLDHYVVNGAVYNLSYDLLKDFEPVAMLANGPQVILSRNTLAAKNLAELVVWLKANPEGVTFATGGLASPPHVGGLSLQALTGNKFQFVPFRGSAPALQQVVGGHLDVDDRSGIGIASRPCRAAACAPTRSRQEAPYLRPGHPDRRRGRIARLPCRDLARRVAPKARRRTLWRRSPPRLRVRSPTRRCRKRLADIGQELPAPEQTTPDGFAAFHKAEMERWTPIIKAANIKPEG